MRTVCTQDEGENIFQTPQEVVKGQEEARQLLLNLSEDQRELLYRLSLVSTAFRKDYALNIGKISKAILHPGDIFDQLVGPWIDPVNERYYMLSPLLSNAAEQVWSESEINHLHAEIANAILEIKNLTTVEARAIFFHSILGQNKEGLIIVIQALLAAPEDDWPELSQEFLLWMRFKTEPPEELFPGKADCKSSIQIISISYCC